MTHNQSKQEKNESARKQQLTPKQAEFLASFAVLVERGKGQSPTLDEMARELGVTKSTVRTYVGILTRKGFLVGDKGKHRSLRVA